MEVLYSDAHSMDKKMKLFQCSDPMTVQVRKGQKENAKVFILSFIPQIYSTDVHRVPTMCQPFIWTSINKSDKNLCHNSTYSGEGY